MGFSNLILFSIFCLLQDFVPFDCFLSVYHLILKSKKIFANHHRSIRCLNAETLSRLTINPSPEILF